VAYRSPTRAEGLDIRRIDGRLGDDKFMATPIAASFMLLDLIR
jgi:hypothetical protein